MCNPVLCARLRLATDRSLPLGLSVRGGPLEGCGGSYAVRDIQPGELVQHV